MEETPVRVIEESSLVAYLIVLTDEQLAKLADQIVEKLKGG
jgi:hypothetical protein